MNKMKNKVWKQCSLQNIVILKHAYMVKKYFFVFESRVTEHFEPGSHKPPIHCEKKYLVSMDNLPLDLGPPDF